MPFEEGVPKKTGPLGTYIRSPWFRSSRVTRKIDGVIMGPMDFTGFVSPLFSGVMGLVGG